MLQSKLLTFINPFLSYIDSGKLFRKPFSWLYIALAAINALIPFIFLVSIFGTASLIGGATYTMAAIFSWLFITAACWVGVQIGWNRKDKVLETSKENDDFPITPVIAHFIQTFGEWLGSFTAIAGFGLSLSTALFLGSAASGLSSMMGGFGAFAGIGFAGIIVNPLLGFLIIIGFRFLAEQFRALAAIANNTRRLP
ncbi:MAG: hypothetical protein LBE91_16675 [Tannerella sp.]|jgi:hypothetical protein|nr:hypothetical protein [Tannerella sp.]